MGDIVEGCCKRDYSKNDNIIHLPSIKQSHFIQRHQNPWESYEETDELGKGFYGIVKKVRLIKNPEVIRAMKIIPEDKILQGEGASLIDEIEILKKLDHPNIMKVYESFVFDGDYYIISELCDQGHLLSKLEKLGKMDEIVVKFLMKQIFDAIAYLHSKHIMHGDIKLENVLLYKTSKRNDVEKFTVINKIFNFNRSTAEDIKNNYGKRKVSDESKTYLDDMMNYEIKLIDFGCSRYFVKQNKKRKLKGIIGTCMYCSPEVVDDLYDEISDEWSCGVLMYILLTGTAPFLGETEEECFKQIKKCDYSFSHPAFDNVSKNCKDLIRKLLEPNTRYRIRAKDALIHPFFTEDFDPSIAMIKNIDFSYLKQLIIPKKFCSKFHKRIFSYLCVNFISVDEENNLRKLFRFINKKANNIISQEELKQCLNDIDINFTEEKFDEIFKSIDENNTGYIEYQEFIRNACNINLILNETNIKNAFQAICQSKDSINGEDIKKFVFHDIDINEITLEEFFTSIRIKYEDNIGFNDFYHMIKHNKKFGEKIEESNNLEYLEKDPLIKNAIDKIDIYINNLKKK